MNLLQLLRRGGQSVWLDDFERSWITNGKLQHYIDDDGLRGLLSNFESLQAAIEGKKYDRYFGTLARQESQRSLAPSPQLYYTIIKETKMLDFLNPILGRHPEQIKANVEIYTWQTCPFCIRAKMLLWWKGVKYTEYKIDGDEAARNKMADRANGRRSVPQIFINNQHIGGCDDIYQLDTQANLDSLLTQPAV